MDVELLLALEEASLEAGVTLSSSLYPSALFWSGSSDAFLAYKLKNWLASTRRRTRTSSCSIGPGQLASLSELSKLPLDSTHMESIVDNDSMLSPSIVWQDLQRMGLQERLSKAVELDINSAGFTWETLVSLHHSEHTASTKSTKDDMSKPLEVTVNSGGVVYFAIFKENLIPHIGEREAAAVLKFTSSSLVTQSERLGNELAKHMGVFCPQSRVIYKDSLEWKQLQKAAERCLNTAKSNENEDNVATCMELLEALSLSQCVLLMGYIKGRPFLDSQHALKTQAAAESTATALARVFLLDLILRNEDRLFCSELGWRGNPANLLFTDEPPLGHQSFGRLLYPGERAKALNNKQEYVIPGERKFPSVDSLHGLQSCDSLLWRTTMPNSQENGQTIDFAIQRSSNSSSTAQTMLQSYFKTYQEGLSSSCYLKIRLKALEWSL